MDLLPSIDSPKQLKELSLKQLPQLAQEIRREIIQTVTKTGGHLASNLGAVELTVALHYVLDMPKDKIIWDVGHQVYTHKILTGRKSRLKTLRQWQGLSGFPSREESVYDTFSVGHGSTSISTALGLACARPKQDKKHSPRRAKIVAVIGDASLGGGMALEALNHAGQLQRDLIVIVNDNKMAISRSVGALSRYLNRIITTPIYNRIRRDLERLLKRLPRFGPKLFSTARRLEESLKNLLVPGILFEELGFRYFGPINGHDINEIIATMKNVLQLEGPVLIHAVTIKGKGLAHAEKIPEKFHGVSSDADLLPVPETKAKSFTRMFSEKMVCLAKKNQDIIAITAAMPEGTGLDKFARLFPERFYDVGMAEAHAIGFSAGLAQAGLRPIVAIYSTFLQRAYDQIIHDICLQNLPVVLCLDRSGVVGEDGVTHQGIFDLAYLRHLPNLTVLAPKDGQELQAMLDFTLGFSGPLAMRYPKGKTPDFSLLLGRTYSPAKIRYSKAEVLRQGKDAAILALGSMVYPSLQAANELCAQGIDCTVVNMRFAKPLDEALIKKICAQVDALFTVEEGVGAGGFGSGVWEFLERNGYDNVRLRRIGLPCEFIPHAKREFLLKKYGLTAGGIKEIVLKGLSEKRDAETHAGI